MSRTLDMEFYISRKSNPFFFDKLPFIQPCRCTVDGLNGKWPLQLFKFPEDPATYSRCYHETFLTTGHNLRMWSPLMAFCEQFLF